MFAKVPGIFSSGPTKWQYLWSATPNEIGDTLAGFAGTLAFVWIIITVLLQSKELAAQRKELVSTRFELKLSRQAFEKTNSQLEQQGFESLFFELITTQNSIVESIDLRDTQEGNVVSSGRDCFTSFSRQLELTAGERMYPDNVADETDQRYLKMYSRYQSDLGHYFRFIHNAMRVIDESMFSKLHHRRLFRALFSDDELLVIFYNARSPQGKNMIPLIESFRLFDNLPLDRLIFKEHRDFFSEKCFGAQI